MINEDEDDNDDAIEFHFGLRLLDRVVLYASFHNISWRQPGPRVQRPAVLVRKFEQHSQRRIREVDDTRLCGFSLPIEPIAHSTLGRSRPGPKSPTKMIWF